MAKKDDSSLAKQLLGLAIAQGVLAVLFGVVALFLPGLTVALLLLFFGIFVLVWGIVGLIISLSRISSYKFWWLELIFSLLAIGLAVYVLRNPVDTAAFFVVVIGLTFLVRGVIDLLQGLFDGEADGNDRAFHVIVGVLGVVAGIIALLHPVSAGVAVVWVVGLYAILYGSLMIAFAFKAQESLK
ncbi:DUF308 domain-containing protein [Candidatus Saccharibacteria bacterium TM7i]|nr:DUF308 domain-containing protein [Candidatus Saccharibacteria bacterium TM7i]